MEALVPAFIAFIALAGLVAFDLLALRFGADSRPTDRRRPCPIDPGPEARPR